MTWTNAFDAGEVSVIVSKGGTPVWQGVLAKGEESPTFTQLSKTLQVSVSGAGDVTLSCSSPDYAGGFVLQCQPLYETGGTAMRASAITAHGAYLGEGYAYFNDEQADPVALTFAVDGSATPDPVSSVGQMAVAEYVWIEARGGS